MNDAFRSFLGSLSTPPSRTASTWRVRLVRPLLAGALAMGLLALVAAILEPWGPVPTLATALVYVLLSAVVVWRAEFRLQVIALVLSVFLLGTPKLAGGEAPADAIFYFLASLFFACLLWSLLAGAVTGAAGLLALGLAGIFTAGAAASTAPEWMLAITAMLLASLAVIAGFQQIEMELASSRADIAEAQEAIARERATLEERVEARTLQWRAGIEVAQAANAIHDPDQLVKAVVNLISDRFGYYYAAIFLVDEEGEFAVLREATGEAGRLLKENRHSLPVAGQNMVGSAIASRKARISLDTDMEAVRFANPLLPYTRSEIAVPLTAGDRVLGALDVQSTSPGAFTEAEVDTLQGMANQVAIAFENARLFQEARQNMEEMQAIQRQYISSAWQPLAGRPDMQYTIGESDQGSAQADLEVPLSLRDQIIGEINLSGEKDWTSEQRGMVEAIATQAALALENARLVEATQSTARREHLLADITGKLWSSATVDGVLRTALAELASALDSDHATIELRMDDLHE